MGQAKNRTRMYEQAKRHLLAGCDDDAKVVATSAINLFERFILPQRYTGGCYLVTLILHRFLEDEHGIATTTTVGYVNDGTDNIMISHAWLMHEERKTDLTLSVMEHPDVTKPGGLLVLDNILKPGVLDYSYHLQRSAEALIETQRLLNDPATSAIVQHKEMEHQAMLARSQSKSLMDAYIAAAPPKCGYAAMTAVLR